MAELVYGHPGKDGLDSLKALQKEGLPEDDFKRAEKNVQKATDDMVDHINQALSSKRIRFKTGLEIIFTFSAGYPAWLRLPLF